MQTPQANEIYTVHVAPHYAEYLVINYGRYWSICTLGSPMPPINVDAYVRTNLATIFDVKQFLEADNSAALIETMDIIQAVFVRLLVERRIESVRFGTTGTNWTLPTEAVEKEQQLMKEASDI